jgi:hypothetical protein
MAGGWGGVGAGPTGLVGRGGVGLDPQGSWVGVAGVGAYGWDPHARFWC